MSGQYYQPPPQQYQAPSQYPPQYGPKYEHADIVHRIVAYIIDAIIIGLILGTIIAVVAISAISQMDLETLESMDPQELASGFTVEIVIISLLAFAFSLLYFIIQEGGPNNATIGKKLMHLKVVDTNYQPIDMSKALIRNIMRLQFLTQLSFLILIIDVILILSGRTSRE
jgi:uncharacterized RDD family membrane protein YckC